MRKAKVKKIILDQYGSYLGMEKGCFIKKSKNGKVEKYPLFEEEIGEVILKTGSIVSTGVLASLGFWEIDTMIMTRRGKPVAMLKSLEYDTYVKTRLCQYEIYLKDRMQIATELVTGKLKGQNQVLRKYGLKQHNFKVETDNIRRLLWIEGKYSRDYFQQIFQLFPKWLNPHLRKTYKTYDGLNNTFNLAYEILKWKVHIALIKAKVEPYLGFLHSLTRSTPSLVCDFQELYRYLIDDFLIRYCQRLRKKDFILKWETFSKKRKGKRQFLNNEQTRELMKSLGLLFEKKVEIPRIRRGQRQTIETLINEEALLFAKYIRGERGIWIPRIVTLD